ncbi:restriction endonuclease subunit S [Cellulomonas sp.]|uniref:restriction endonuclease subunit S n=1 Tax=Cellulomonas sp. TaxID=40001 RepID=UPI0033901E8E
MLNRNFIGQVPVRVPPVNEQRAIAEVLGALDDKIAANHRTAGGADALAMSLFDQAVRGIAFGPDEFADVAEVGGGGTPSTKVPEYWDGSIAWAAPTDVTRLPGPYLFETARSLTPAGLASCASPVYPEGAVLMTSRATVGAFALAQRPVAVNQGFIVVFAPDPDTRMWLFHEMRSRVPEFLNHANGATFLEPVEAASAVYRSASLTALAAPSSGHERRHFTPQPQPPLAENLRLTRLRDTLLPSLMSGRLRVRDAESVVSDAL